MAKKMTFSDTKKKRSITIKVGWVVMGAVILIGIATFAVWFLFRKPNPTTKPNEPNAVVEQKFYSPLTGREVANESITKRPVVAVMIENSTDARPQSGIADAGVVFEAIAEGGITRFIALYQESEPEFIGPVRSARPYYLEWALSFDPAVIHVGGSNEALDMLRSGRYGLDIDEIDDQVIYRANDRFAPHNAYTNYTKYSAYLEKRDKITSDFVGWERRDGTGWQCECPPDAICDCVAPTGTVKIGISSGAFTVSYDYDAATNTYKRSVGGVPHMDREKGQISPDVVIAMRSNYGLMADGLHSKYQTTGENEMYIFQDGGVTKGTWQKSDMWSQIKFIDENGVEIKLNRGQVWITAVEQNKEVSFN